MDTKYIRIDAFHMTRTYGGCLEGLPTSEETIASARRLAKELWGERATMLIPPPVTNGACPQWMFFAWLNAPAMDAEHHGSELVVIWWQAEIDDGIIPGALFHDLGCGSWEKYAADYFV